MLMKIEKINENQIRCTLTKEDLASRQLKLSELAYGTEKAKRLFREMMQQANFEFGFEAEDIPLMIEAIPMNAECVVLLITKRFSPSDNTYDEEDEEPFEGYSDDMMDALRPFTDQRQKEEAALDESGRTSRIFLFRTLSEVMNAAAQVGSSCPCPTALYKDAKNDGYLLTVNKGESNPEDYARLCNMLSEYGKVSRGMLSESFIKEHYEVILATDALKNLAF